MHARTLHALSIVGLALCAATAGGCTRHIKDVELVSVVRIPQIYQAPPKLRISFTSRSDFRGLRGTHAYLWTSLCPIRDGMVVNFGEVDLEGRAVKPGQDVPRHVEDDAPPLVYTGVIDYDKVWVETDYPIDTYHLLLPPDAVDLCFRVESAGWKRFRTNDVMIPKAAIAAALMAPPRAP